MLFYFVASSDVNYIVIVLDLLHRTHSLNCGPCRVMTITFTRVSPEEMLSESGKFRFMEPTIGDLYRY